MDVDQAYTGTLIQPVFLEQPISEVYLFMAQYFPRLEDLRRPLPKYLIDAYTVMLQHFLESALPYSADSVHRYLRRLKLNAEVCRLMHYSEQNGMGEADDDDANIVKDSAELSRQKAKAKELMDMLTGYAAWYSTNGRLMMRPCASFVARTCEKVHAKEVELPAKMIELDEYSMQSSVTFNAEQDGKVCIVINDRQVTASVHDLDRLKRAINPRTSSSLYLKCKGPIRHFTIDDNAVDDTSQLFVELGKAIGLPFKAYVNACTLQRFLKDKTSAVFVLEPDPQRAAIVLAGASTYRMAGDMSMVGEFHCEEGHTGSVYKVFKLGGSTSPASPKAPRVSQLDLRQLALEASRTTASQARTEARSELHRRQVPRDQLDGAMQWAHRELIHEASELRRQAREARAEAPHESAVAESVAPRDTRRAPRAAERVERLEQLSARPLSPIEGRTLAERVERLEQLSARPPSQSEGRVPLSVRIDRLEQQARDDAPSSASSGGRSRRLNRRTNGARRSRKNAGARRARLSTK
jgi:hypothetical protein